MIKNFDQIMSDFSCINEIWDDGINIADTLRDIEKRIPGRASTLMQTLYRLVINQIPHFPDFDKSEFVENLQLWIDFYNSKIDSVNSNFYEKYYLKKPEEAFGKRENIPNKISIEGLIYQPIEIFLAVKNNAQDGLILKKLKESAKKDLFYDFKLKDLKYYIVEMANSDSKWNDDNFIFPTEPPTTFQKHINMTINSFRTFRNGAMLKAIAQLYRTVDF